MMCGLWLLAFAVLSASAASLPVAELRRETAVDFEKEILPIFRNSCLACHNTTKAKGGLNLETPQLITRGRRHRAGGRGGQERGKFALQGGGAS